MRSNRRADKPLREESLYTRWDFGRMSCSKRSPPCLFAYRMLRNYRPPAESSSTRIQRPGRLMLPLEAPRPPGGARRSETAQTVGSDPVLSYSSRSSNPSFSLLSRAADRSPLGISPSAARPAYRSAEHRNRHNPEPRLRIQKQLRPFG